MGRKATPLDTSAMAWEEFVSGYRVGMAALMGPGGPAPVVTGADETAKAADLMAEGGGSRADAISGEGKAHELEDLDEQTRAKLEANPYSRVLLALREHFGSDYANFRPLIYRFWGLYDLVHRGRLPEWVETREDGTLGLHPALLMAAAEVKLTKKGKLPVDRFRAHVAWLIETELGTGVTDQVTPKHELETKER